MDAGMRAEHIAFQGEVQLLNWSETHNGGAKIVLQLADAADLESFKAMTVRKGKVAGQRLAVVMVEIGDDEQPVPQSEQKSRPGELCVMACTFCADPQFQYWASTQCGACDTEAEAKRFILGMCWIESRKELDTSAVASGRFHKYIREPYLAWRKQP
jgi:hypothetical protein